MKKTPYIFLVVLIVILVFLIGFRSGQKVEKTNKTIDYMISIAPTIYPPTNTPSPTKEASASPTVLPKQNTDPNNSF